MCGRNKCLIVWGLYFSPCALFFRNCWVHRMRQFDNFLKKQASTLSTTGPHAICYCHTMSLFTCICQYGLCLCQTAREQTVCGQSMNRSINVSLKCKINMAHMALTFYIKKEIMHIQTLELTVKNKNLADTMIKQTFWLRGTLTFKS